MELCVGVPLEVRYVGTRDLNPSIRLVWLSLEPPSLENNVVLRIGRSWRLVVNLWHSLSSFDGVDVDC